jgi:hypothetical protein
MGLYNSVQTFFWFPGKDRQQTTIHPKDKQQSQAIDYRT